MDMDDTWNPYKSVEWLFGNSDNSDTFVGPSTSSRSSDMDIYGFPTMLGDAGDSNPQSLDNYSMVSLSSPGNTSVMDYLEGSPSPSCKEVTYPEAIQGDVDDGSIVPRLDLSVAGQVIQAPVNVMAVSAETQNPSFFQQKDIAISNSHTSGGQYRILCPFSSDPDQSGLGMPIEMQDIKPDIKSIKIKLEASYPTYDTVTSHHNYSAPMPPSECPFSTFTADSNEGIMVPIKIEPFVPTAHTGRRRKQVFSTTRSSKTKPPTKKPKAEAAATTTTKEKVLGRAASRNKKHLYEYTEGDIKSSRVKDKGKLRNRVIRAVNTKRHHDKIKNQNSTLINLVTLICKHRRQNVISILASSPDIMSDLQTYCPEIMDLLS